MQQLLTKKCPLGRLRALRSMNIPKLLWAGNRAGEFEVFMRDATC